MLIGIFGAHATGKTTFMKHMLDTIQPPAVNNRKLVIVLADNGTEYHLCADDEGLYYEEHKDDSQWKGKQEDKIDKMNEMISDHHAVWIVESARYFTGMYELRDMCIKYNGGLRFIVPTCTPQVFKEHLISRCKKANKKFRDDYWVAGKLDYESSTRYVRVLQKHFDGINIEVKRLTVTNYSEWDMIEPLLQTWVNDPIKRWYSK